MLADASVGSALRAAEWIQSGEIVAISTNIHASNEARISIQSQTMIFNFADGHRGARTFVAPKAQENDPDV